MAFDILDIIGKNFSMLVKFLDNAYKEKWLLYLSLGLVGFLIYVIFF